MPLAHWHNRQLNNKQLWSNNGCSCTIQDWFCVFIAEILSFPRMLMLQPNIQPRLKVQQSLAWVWVLTSQQFAGNETQAETDTVATVHGGNEDGARAKSVIQYWVTPISCFLDIVAQVLYLQQHSRNSLPAKTTPQWKQRTLTRQLCNIINLIHAFSVAYLAQRM